MILSICSLGNEIGLMFHCICSIVYITIGSTIVKLAHLVSLGKKAKVFSCYSCISQVWFSPSIKRKSHPPTQSFFQVSFIIHTFIFIEVLDIVETSFILCWLFTGPTISFMSLSTLLYIVLNQTDYKYFFFLKGLLLQWLLISQLIQSESFGLSIPQHLQIFVSYFLNTSFPLLHNLFIYFYIWFRP